MIVSVMAVNSSAELPLTRPKVSLSTVAMARSWAGARAVERALKEAKTTKTRPRLTLSTAMLWAVRTWWRGGSIAVVTTVRGDAGAFTRGAVMVDMEVPLEGGRWYRV